MKFQPQASYKNRFFFVGSLLSVRMQHYAMSPASVIHRTDRSLDRNSHKSA